MKKVIFAMTAMAALAACSGTTNSDGMGGKNWNSRTSTQSVKVTSSPSGATCWLHNDAGRTKVASTPGTVEVTNNGTDMLKVACMKDGNKGSAIIKQSGNGYASPVHIMLQDAGK